MPSGIPEIRFSFSKFVIQQKRGCLKSLGSLFFMDKKFAYASGIHHIRCIKPQFVAKIVFK
jgi:hypothetical protein